MSLQQEEQAKDREICGAAEKVAQAAGILYGNVKINVVAGEVKSVLVERSVRRNEKPLGNKT